VKKRSWGILGFIILLCALYLTPVSAASYVKQAETKVSTTSKKHGWIRHGNDYYYYNSKGKLLVGEDANTKDNIITAQKMGSVLPVG